MAAAETSSVAKLGEATLQGIQRIGGITLMFGRIIAAFFPPLFDRYESWRNLYKVGVKSCPIVILTALFTGALMVIQTAPFVERTGATGLLGWGAGFAVLAEIGPVLIGLMFSGRVGANNAAELGTMKVTEQVDALRALAIDPIRYLVVPRFLSMMVMLLLLTCIGDLFALIGGAITSELLLGVDWRTFFWGVVDAHLLKEFAVGLGKGLAFGMSISVVSCYFGLNVSGGAPGVGRAVNASVVTNAIGIFALDFGITYGANTLV